MIKTGLKSDLKGKLLENHPLLLLNSTDRACKMSKVFLKGDNPASNLTRANGDILGYPPKPPEPPERPKDLETEPKGKLMEKPPMLLNGTDRAYKLLKVLLKCDNPAYDLT